MVEIFSNIVVPFILFISGGLAHYIWHCYNERYLQSKTRFEKLYAPFTKLIWKKTHGAFNFSDLTPSLRSEFLTILVDNYEYMSSNLKQIFYEFHCTYEDAYLDKYGHNDTNLRFHMIQETIEYEFNLLCKTLFLDPFDFHKSKGYVANLERRLLQSKNS